MILAEMIEIVVIAVETADELQLGWRIQDRLH